MLKDDMRRLLDIQDCQLIIEESNILHSELEEGSFSELKSKIETLRVGLSDRLLANYDRLRARGVAVAREQDGRCKACHMPIATGDLARFERSTDPCMCPNCHVYLYLSAYEKEA